MTHPFDLLAGLLEYPRADHHASLQAALGTLTGDARDHVATFAGAVAGLSLADREELYTSAFDLNPASSLEVGWHLYGENYARGELMVLFRRKLREVGLRESGELPDHLTHVLPLLARLPADEAGALAGQYVAPAMERMLAAMAGKAGPFESLLRAAQALVAPLAARYHPPAGPERARPLPLVDPSLHEVGHD